MVWTATCTATVWLYAPNLSAGRAAVVVMEVARRGGGWRGPIVAQSESGG